MAQHYTQKEKAQQFHALHHTGKLLVLPNIWDPLGAVLLESLSFPAIATASAAIAFTNGYNDGEHIPFDDMLNTIGKIVASVHIPVTADIESGYAGNDTELEKNITRLIEKGIAGINLEDTDNRTNALFPADVQCNRIRLIKKVAAIMDVPLFINARTDVLLHGKEFTTPESKTDEIQKRGWLYKEAGADGFFPIGLKQAEAIHQLVSELKMPVNILTIPGIPDLQALENMGVARVSLGPSFLKIAIKAMKNLALQLKDQQGLSSITENEITTDYLKTLIKTTEI